MSPIGLALLSGLALLASSGLWPAPVDAAVEIAVLNSSEIAAYRDAITGFKAAGPSGALYTEYDLQGDLETGRKLAKKIRASDAALVLAVGLKAALAAKLEIVDVPVVYMMVLDPAKHRLAAPNVTGTLLEVPAERQLKTIRAFLPKARRLGLLYDPKKNAAKVKEIEPQAANQALSLDAVAVDGEKDVPQRLREVLATADALWLLPDSTVLTNESIHFLLELALAQRIPVIGFSPEFARLGALLTISVNYGEVGRETGLLARRILNGDQLLPLAPAAIDRVKLSVNMKTARFLGLTFSKDLESLIDETF